MQEIYIPVNITYETAVEFSKKLKEANLNEYKDNNIKIDIGNLMKNNGRVEPFAALFILNSLRSFARLADKLGFKVRTRYIEEHRMRNIYAKNLRFYSSLGVPYGQSPDEDYQGSSQSTFIPIMKMEASQVSCSTDEYKEISDIARNISTVASRGNKELLDCIHYCVIEVVRNVLEHSGSSTLWYSAQCWPSKHGGQLVEIGIMDEGIGIHESLKQELDDEENLLKFSLVPGCSSKPTTHYIGDNADNSGFGLYMISEIGKRNGDFIIASNNESLLFSEGVEKLDECLINGTLLRLRLHIDSIRNFETQKEELINEGLDLVERYLKYREIKKYAPGLAIIQSLF